MKLVAALFVLFASAGVTAAPNAANPFVGRWDITLTTAKETLPDWLGVSEKAGKLEIWYQPPTANVYLVKDYKLNGSHLTLRLEKGITWELDAVGDKLIGAQKRGSSVQGKVEGVRAAALSRDGVPAWTAPEPLFNGRDLTGWEPTSRSSTSMWEARDGELINRAKGANLKTSRQFRDFKLHIEYNCPSGGNSGIYLRGRYEVQVEYEPLEKNPPERRMGSIYGFLTPAVALPRTPGAWESYDIALVGRTVTIVRDGALILDRKEIPGITGGALDSREGDPGPLYIQGDHTGGLRFRNIAIATAK